MTSGPISTTSRKRTAAGRYTAHSALLTRVCCSMTARIWTRSSALTSASAAAGASARHRKRDLKSDTGLRGERQPPALGEHPVRVARLLVPGGAVVVLEPRFERP